MVNVLVDEIKNTRFILTIIALGMVGLFTIAIFLMAIFKVEMGDVYQGAITTLLGFLIGLATQAFISHFKNQEEIQVAKIETGKALALKTPCMEDP